MPQFNDEFKILEISRSQFSKGWYLKVVFKVSVNNYYYQHFVKGSDEDSIHQWLKQGQLSKELFTFEQAIGNTATARGALQELIDLRDGIVNADYRHATSSYLKIALDTLNASWD